MPAQKRNLKAIMSTNDSNNDNNDEPESKKRKVEFQGLKEANIGIRGLGSLCNDIKSDWKAKLRVLCFFFCNTQFFNFFFCDNVDALLTCDFFFDFLFVCLFFLYRDTHRQVVTKVHYG